jgi:hypothetical protein
MQPAQDTSRQKTIWEKPLLRPKVITPGEKASQTDLRRPRNMVLVFYHLRHVPRPFLFFAVPALELRAYTLSNSTALFCDGFFRDRVL